MNLPFGINPNARERRLLMILGVVAFVVINYFLFGMFWSRYQGVRASLEQQKQEVESLEAQMLDLDQLRSRNEWVVQRGRDMPSRDVASEQLLSKVQEAARGDVIIEKHQFLGVKDRGFYRAMAIELNVKSGWKPFLRFLYDLQAEDKQLAFERLDIKADRQDKTSISAKATILDFYAQ